MRAREIALALLVSLAGVASASAWAQSQPAAPSNESVSERLNRVYADYLEAARRLAAAEKSVELGREPLPGERVGLAGGGSRLRPEYFERQENLARELDAARVQHQQALARWNALR